MAREEDLRQVAEDIADEATKGYEKLFPPHMIAEMRRLLILDMICTDKGRAQLRLCLGDKANAKSDDVYLGDEEDVKKGGSGAA